MSLSLDRINISHKGEDDIQSIDNNFQAIENEINSHLAEFANLPEKIENPNGVAWKFPNGLMLCHLYIQAITDVSPTTQSEGGLTTYRQTLNWTFPEKFVGIPSVHFQAIAANGNAVLRFTSSRLYSQSSEMAGGQITGIADFDTIQFANWYAIGRWK